MPLLECITRRERKSARNSSQGCIGAGEGAKRGAQKCYTAHIEERGDAEVTFLHGKDK